MKYRNAAALRQALEERLRAQALQTGMPLMRLRKMVAFERLLARLVARQDDVWILKGGFALELRLGIRARTTNDLDLLSALPLAAEQMHQSILQAARQDFQDGFQFEVGKPSNLNLPRFPVHTLLDGRTFENFHLDVGTGDPIVGSLEYITTPNLLEFADIPPLRVPCYPLTQQLAEKIHAYTLLYKSGESTRIKDWVDMLLIAQAGKLSAKRLANSIHATFKARQTHNIPDELPMPPANWTRPFKKLASEVQLDYDDLAEASHALDQFLAPILTGRTFGHWNPSAWRWE